MRIFSVFLLNILLDTSSKGISEAFVVHQYNVASVAPFGSLSRSSELAFHPQKVEDGDFRTPAESFTFTRYANVAVSSEYVQSEWKEDNDLKRLSYLDVISSTTSVSSSHDEDEDATDSETSEEPLAQAHRIQQAYREWCEFYGKIANKERLGVFATNFLAVQEFHERTGRPLVLNEFADMTEEEYKKRNQPSKSDESVKNTTTEKFQADDRIREAYRQWCEYYEKTFDEKRLRTFAANFIAVEKYHLQTKESLVLNEFADMTEKEYRKHLATAAHFTTPENIGPRASEGSNLLLKEQKETIKMDNDPITSYLDPEPTPINIPQVDELKPPIPRSQTQIVHSNYEDSNPSASSDTTRPLDASSSSNEVIAALQKTVESLSAMVQSLMKASQPVAPQPRAEPLDSLVIDVLQQQDGSISQLEESVEGLHEIQKQGSDLIELVSNNQKHMTEMMEAVQSEVSALQEDKKQVEVNYAMLLNRIEELEGTVAKLDSNDPVLKRSLVLSPATATRRRRVEVKPNIPPVGMVSSMFKPIDLEPYIYP